MLLRLARIQTEELNWRRSSSDILHDAKPIVKHGPYSHKSHITLRIAYMWCILLERLIVLGNAYEMNWARPVFDQVQHLA